MRSLVVAACSIFLFSSAAVPQPASAQSTGPAGKPDNAICLGCHGTEGFSAPRADGTSRSLFVPAEKFAAGVHGKSLQCVDCHAPMAGVPHGKISATLAEWRTNIQDMCATCHEKALKSYQATLHGQIATLGYADTATCADCHGSHAILPARDPASRVNAANLLKTCRECHNDASAGYATFQPHATTDDFARYPQMWLAARFMVFLLVFTFGIFWAHSALWFWAEYRDRRRQTARPHVRAEALPQEQGKYYTRWTPMWRVAHLLFTVTFILLVATAIPLLYPDTAWAPLLIKLFGGPAVSSTVHKVSAVIMVAVFAGHLAYVAIFLAKNWSTFEWFGPYSLMPTWQDARDIAAMSKWFVGRGPRPTFDHWNYTQKVDYWAPFWGIAMLTGTGAMLWFTTLTATYLPGWTFNVATIVHGEEALLAAVYLFTIHFFANHWRPDKFPMDVVMFTGSMPIEEFKREYGVEYQRLAETGQLEKYLVDAPARPMTLASKLLGFTLVAIGLALLVMMVDGFIG